MIRVGFICEGYTEQILLQSSRFRQLLASLNIESVQVINAEGSGNLLPRNIVEYTARLERRGARIVIILTDMDDDSCITETKKRISARKQDVMIVAVQKIEAWFLACTPAMRNVLGQPGFECSNPEEEHEPFEAINNLLIAHSGRGIGKKTAGKKKLINRLLENGLDLADAATHGNCPSAAYFLRKLKEIGAAGIHGGVGAAGSG
jgi:predicted ATP-dependent endonuclease of OLD family